MMESHESELGANELLIWLGALQHPDAPIYNMVATFLIEKAVDPDRFRRAFQTVVDESEALRSTFGQRDGRPFRQVRAHRDAAMPLIDLSGKADPDSAYEAWVAKQRSRRLDLESCAFHSALLKLAGQRFVWYLNQHHLITDAWSTALVFRRLAALYREPSRSRRGSAARYGEVRSIRHTAKTAKSQEIERYWRARVDQWRRNDGLTCYGAEPRDIDPRSERISIDLGPARSRRIEQAAQHEALRSLNRDTTLFQIFASVLFALLYRTSCNSSLTIGAPTAQRRSLVEKETIGLFMEMFPLGVRIEAGECLQGLFDKVREESIEFIRHAQPGFSNPDVVRVFEVLLNYVKAPFPEFDGIPVQVRFVHAGASEPQHLIRLQVNDFEQADRILLDFDFNCAALAPPLRRTLADHYLKLLDAFLDDPVQRIDAIDLLGEGERERLLVTLNDTATATEDGRRLESLVAEQARLHPDRTAVVHWASQISYATLVRRSRQLAHRLIGSGVTPGDRVALALDRGVDLVVGMIATLEAGAVYVPVDTSLPLERQRSLLQQSRVAATLAERHKTPVLQMAATGALLSMDADGAQIGRETYRPQAVADLNAGDAAYVLFTSGSTGKPNGVICHHRGVVNLLQDFENRGALEEGARCGWWTSSGFDVSVYEIFGALAFGRTLHIVPEEIRADADRYFDWMRDNAIVSGFIPPFMLDTFARRSADAPGRLALKRLLVGVEPTARSTLSRIAANNPGLLIINGYGPTETTICATHYEVPVNDDSDDRTPIGRPVLNTRLYLLDRLGQPVPFGAPGELYIGGRGVAHGYLGRPDLTRERFVPDPFSSSPGSRLYRSGDRVRYLPDGNLEFLGRVDHQLKIHGQRIEPSEIEHALSRHPDVSEALATAVGDGADRQLVAYLVTNADSLPDAAGWHQRLASRLPLHMIPSAYVPLAAFPLTANGKIDRRALPPPVDPAIRQDASPRPAETPLQSLLVETWESVLAHRPIGLDDNFLEFGGDSIRAMQIAARAKERGVDINPRQIFEQQTIARLAQVARQTSVPEGRSDEAADPGPSQRGATIDVRGDIDAASLDALLTEYGDDD